MPVVGYMMEKSVVPNGSTVSVAGWTQPVAEPEIAVYMAADLAGGAGRDATIAAIGALGPAIELADLAAPPTDVEAVLAGNIFHRSVILGAPDKSRAGAKLDGLAGLVFRRGAQVARQEDLQANIGNIVDIVAHVAGTLAANGEKLRAGDVIITGSIVPPPDDRAGRDRVRLSARADGAGCRCGSRAEHGSRFRASPRQWLRPN